jgi:thiol-disulfide isomerase/thioredoxin
MKKLIVIALFTAIRFNGFSQIEASAQYYPEVGLRCPAFILNDVHDYPKHQVSLEDFKGKWLILDFWNEHCGGCIASFPETNKLQERFGDKVKFLLVGCIGSQYNWNNNSDNESIRSLYKRISQKEKLKLLVAFDSVLFHRFDIGGCPYIVCVDPSGIVRGITTSINEKDIDSLLAEKHPHLQKAWRWHENSISYNPNLPFLINGNDGNDTAYLYRSVLSEFKENMYRDTRFKISKNIFQVIGVDLMTLYRFAYTGITSLQYGDSLYARFSISPVLKIHDPSLFKFNYAFRTNMFCYSISFPSTKGTKQSVMKMMRRDLKNYFEYDVFIEKREMPVWKLVIVPRKDEQQDKRQDKAFNHEYKYVKALLLALDIENSGDIPFVNETGLEANVNIKLNCNLNDLDDVKNALRENGFDLVKGEKEMKVLVIRDPKIEEDEN